MKQLLVAHAPHLAFVMVGVIAFVWTATRKPASGAGGAPPPGHSVPPADPAVATTATPGRGISRRLARRAGLALGPLLAALATGAVLYGTDVGGVAAPSALILVHAGISTLALVLVVYKLADLGRAGLRRALTGPALASAALGAASVPLLVTGIALIVAPGRGSFAAYAHLIASAWWTGLLLWHLRRYLGPSLRALRAQRAPSPRTADRPPSPRPLPEAYAVLRRGAPARAPRSARAWPATPPPSGSTPRR